MSSWQPISLNPYRGVRTVTGERIRKLERPKLIRVTDYIAANLDQPINLRTLAGVVGQSPFHFAKSFRATTGVPPYTFVTDRRMDAAMTLLRTTRLPIRKVAERTGFSSSVIFSFTFVAPGDRTRRSSVPISATRPQQAATSE